MAIVKNHPHEVTIFFDLPHGEQAEAGSHDFYRTLWILDLGR